MHGRNEGNMYNEKVSTCGAVDFFGNYFTYLEHFWY